VLLELKNIEKIYDLPSGSASRKVLNNVSLQVSRGESIAVVGPSGSGKSTLLNIIGSLDKPTSGKVFLDGRDLSKCNESKLAEIRNKKMGFVFQLHHLLPQCTLLENVLIPTLVYNTEKHRSSVQKYAEELLERVNLTGLTDYRPGQLSGGEQQRVAVVRAMINRPQLILADEPTGSLDTAAADNLGQLLVELNKEKNVTLIVVTHSTKLAGYMDKIYNLTEGQLDIQAK
jgi:ABC-type lipoprotein export system ATPase subunit